MYRLLRMPRPVTHSSQVFIHGAVAPHGTCSPLSRRHYYHCRASPLPQMFVSVAMPGLFTRARGDRVMLVGRVGNDVTQPSIGRATGPMGSSSRHRDVRHWKPSGSMTNGRLLWRALNIRQKTSFLELIVHLGSCKDHCDASRRYCLNIVSGVYNTIRDRIHGVNVQILRSLHLAERPAVLHLPGT